MWLAHEVAIYSLRNNMLVQSSVNWDDVIKANVWPKLNSRPDQGVERRTQHRQSSLATRSRKAR